MTSTTTMTQSQLAHLCARSNDVRVYATLQSIGTSIGLRPNVDYMDAPSLCMALAKQFRSSGGGGVGAADWERSLLSAIFSNDIRSIQSLCRMHTM